MGYLPYQLVNRISSINRRKMIFRISIGRFLDSSSWFSGVQVSLGCSSVLVFFSGRVEVGDTSVLRRGQNIKVVFKSWFLTCDSNTFSRTDVAPIAKGLEDYYRFFWDGLLIYDRWDVGQAAQMLVKVPMDQALRTWKFLAVLGSTWHVMINQQKIIFVYSFTWRNPQQNLNNTRTTFQQIACWFLFFYKITKGFRYLIWRYWTL